MLEWAQEHRAELLLRKLRLKDRKDNWEATEYEMDQLNTSTNKELLESAERNAAKDLEAPLAKHTALTLDAFNLLGETLGCLPTIAVRKMPLSRRVAAALLARVSNELRCAVLLVSRGYSTQAATVVSSMHEVAYCLSYIGSDNSLAEQWIKHVNPSRPFRSAKALTFSALKVVGVKESKAIERQYQTYQQLCMSKHANPLFQMQHAFQLRGGEVRLINGPDTSAHAIRTARFALEHATFLSFMTLAVFARLHLKRADRRTLSPRIKSLADRLFVLVKESAEQYGTEDPFPDVW